MKAIKIELPRNLLSMEIHTFADLHIGTGRATWK